MWPTMRMQHVVVYVLHLLIVIVDCHWTSTNLGNLYASPCPNVFNYYLEDGVLQYGLIRLDNPDTNLIRLNVELSVGNNIENNYKGDIRLASSNSETIQNMMDHKPLMYRLNFPRWYNYPPKITKISVNGRLICQGPGIDLKNVRILTTITLKHRLEYTPGFSANEAETSQQSGAIDFNPQPPEGLFSFFDGTERIPPVVIQPRSTTATPFEHNHNNYFEDNGFNSGPVQPQIGTTEDIDIRNQHSPAFHAQDESTTSQKFPAQVDRGGFGQHGINADECGISFNTNTLIANGRSVQKGQYPWLVAIFHIKSLGPEFLCGGNLISHKHVITAGHCLKSGTDILPNNKVFMRIGEHNIHQWIQVSGSKTVGASQIIVHSDYKAMSADGDIAMIVLAEGVQFSKWIRPICLWTNDIKLDAVVGKVGTVVGWGKDEGANQITSEPKQIKFPIVSQEDCLRSHFTFREITSERTFCGGYRNGSGPCNGDSGGGFIMQRNHRWTLRGVVSMSIAKDRTCDFSQYFVFTDVTKFLGWILSNL